MRNIEEIIWDEWKIDSVLGKGSYGTVYKASKTGFGSSVSSAIKHLSIPYEKSEISAIRAEGMTKAEISEYYKDIVNHISEEIRLMDSLKGNSNIVSIEDFKIIKGNDDFSWDILIRMEILNDLNDYFANKEGYISDIVKVGIDICNALECCEKANIIHRDIKPENIFVNKFNNFKLGDFGIAREYSENRADMSMRGTPYYVAPEVFDGKSYDNTVDIYSLGIVLYRMLNKNRLPFFPVDGIVTFQQRNDALKNRLEGKPFLPPANTTDELTAVIFKACSFNPADRYRNASDMKSDLVYVLHILEQMKDQPKYSFLQENFDIDTADLKSNTYDLQQGTLLLEENQPKTNKKYNKVLLAVIAAVIILFTLTISFVIQNNHESSKVITDSSYSTTELTTLNNKDVNESTVRNEKESTKIKTEKSSSIKNSTSYNSNHNITRQYAGAERTTASAKDKTTKKSSKKKTTAKKSTTKKAAKKHTTKKKSTTKKVSTTKKTVKPTVSLAVSDTGMGLDIYWSSTNADSVTVYVDGQIISSSKGGSKLVSVDAGSHTVKIVASNNSGATASKSITKNHSE